MSKINKKIDWVIVVLATFLLFLLVQYLENIYSSYEVDRQERQLEEEISQLIDDNEQLQNKLEFLTTPSFIEREAKRELDLMKPGEEVTIIKADGSSIDTNTEIVLETDIDLMTNPERWVEFFVGNRG